MVCRLFVKFGNKGAGGASGDALPTGYADGVAYGLIAEGTHFGFIASESQINSPHTGYFPASSDASAAEYAFIGIPIEGRVALIRIEYACPLAKVRETFLFYAQILCDLLQFTSLVLRAGKAIAMVVRENKLHGDLSRTVHLGCFGMDHHTVLCRCCAGTDYAAQSLNLNNTKPASPGRC
jgi:hypothetical protein